MSVIQNLHTAEIVGSFATLRLAQIEADKRNKAAGRKIWQALLAQDAE